VKIGVKFRQQRRKAESKRGNGRHDPGRPQCCKHASLALWVHFDVIVAPVDLSIKPLTLTWTSQRTNESCAKGARDADSSVKSSLHLRQQQGRAEDQLLQAQTFQPEIICATAEGQY
jgi:hypothetical protein